MITYEKFKDIIVKYIAFAKADKVLRDFNIDIIESPFFDTTGYYLDWLWEAYFTEEGCDIISWWIFEYHELEEDFDNNGEYVGEPMKPGMWDENDKVIPMVTIEDLWEAVKEYRKEFVKSTKEELAETITEMVKAHLQANATPIDWAKYKEIIYKNFPEYEDLLTSVFPKDSQLLVLDDEDEITKDIMREYLQKHTPIYRSVYSEGVISLFSDPEVGPLVVITTDECEEYIWSV